MQRPKFFVDENLYHEYAASLRRPFKAAVFRSHVDERLSSTADTAIFAELRARGFTAVLTQDKRQLFYREERDALREAGLHWVGVTDIDARGVDFHAEVIACLVSVIPRLILDAPVTPHAFYVGPSERMKLARPRVEAI